MGLDRETHCHHDAILKKAADALGPTLIDADRQLRYPFSDVCPLQNLAEEFRHSAHHVRKIGDLVKRGYSLRRRVRGDGNCFYRAVGVAWLECLIHRAQMEETTTVLFTWPSPCCFGELKPESEQLRNHVMELSKASKSHAREHGVALFERLLTDLRLDLSVVVLMRCLVATYLLDSDVDSDVRVTVDAQHGSVTNFVSNEVLPLGQEAEGAAILAAASQLGVHLQIFQIDGTASELSHYIYPFENDSANSGMSIDLLFRPGHYEIMYHRSHFHAAATPTIAGRCSSCRMTKPLCSKNLLVCFHRLCRTCSGTAELQRNVDEQPCKVCNCSSLPRRSLSSPACSQRPRSEWFGPEVKRTSTASPREASAHPAGRPTPSTCLSVTRFAKPLIPLELPEDLHSPTQSWEMPELCKNGCGFYGSPGTRGYCSRCFADPDIVSLQEQESRQHHSGEQRSDLPSHSSREAKSSAICDDDLQAVAGATLLTHEAKRSRGRSSCKHMEAVVINQVVENTKKSLQTVFGEPDAKNTWQKEPRGNELEQQETLCSRVSSNSSGSRPIAPPRSAPTPWAGEAPGDTCTICFAEASSCYLRSLHCGAKVHDSCLKEFWLQKVLCHGRLTSVDCPSQESTGCCEILTDRDLFTGVLDESDMFEAWTMIQDMDNSVRTNFATSF